ncbi:MAG TPA: lytic transglycosylase domain-containing protein, partial [Abditibacteriaceae bacterium]|jgi:hypothetical protein
MKNLALLCSLSGALATTLAAQESIAPAVSNNQQTEFANPGAPLETLSYEQIRQLYRVQTFTTPASARANVAELSGAIVEMQGDVSGTMSSNKGRVFIMKIDGALATFMVSPQFRNFDVMRSGNRARILVEVGDDAGFSLVAATPQLASYGESSPEKPDPSKSPRATTNDAIISGDSGINLEEFHGPNTDVIIMSPMSVMTTADGKRNSLSAPAPQVFKSGTPLRGNVLSSRGSVSGTVVGRAGSRAFTNALPPAGGTSNSRLRSLVDEQKPAYINLVRRHNPRLTENQAEEIAAALLSAGVQHNLDPRFLAAVVSVESSFNINSTSRSGAQGLGQIMPFNSRSMGMTDPYNPTQSIYGMAKILRGHLDTFGKFGSRGPLLAVAAYNAGPNAVKRAGNNVPGGAQVQRYVWKVYYRYKEFAPDMFK